MTHDPDGLRKSVGKEAERRRTWLREGEPSFGHYLAQIGILGWTIVLPALLGTFLGRWIDRGLGTGIFWTAPLMMLGLGVGCWTAWRWMHGR
jgi:ATP synthase protein I